MGKSGKFHTGSTSGRVHYGGLDVDNHGPDTEGEMVVQRYRVGGDHLEGLHVNLQQSATKLHFIT